MCKQGRSSLAVSSDAEDSEGARYAPYAMDSLTQLVDPSGELGQQLSSFLNTSAGLAWLSRTLDIWEQRIAKATTPPSVQELNRLLLTKFRDFLSSDVGRRVSQQLHQEMTSGTLVVPVVVVEELVKHRLRSMIRTNVNKKKIFYLKFFSWRVALASTAMHLLRNGIVKAAGRLGPRWKSGAKFVTDVLIAPQVYGPALGILLGLIQLTRTMDLDSSLSLGAESETLASLKAE